jgi:curved DNA-binding protein CbpA
MPDNTPDYYAILSIPSTSSPQQIRDAYKKAALKSHPDRVPSDSPERPARTKKFQQINDAYYTLSDPARRQDYDAARRFHFDTGADGGDEGVDEEIPRTSTGGGFPWSAFGFGSGGGGAANPADAAEQEHFSNEQFGDVFEEMLREEGLAEGHDARPTGKFWSLVGGLSGGAMGFIVANFPGALAGAVAGNRLGAVRDARGKSVYAVFQELPQGDKAKLLSQLAGKVFATVASGAA